LSTAVLWKDERPLWAELSQTHQAELGHEASFASTSEPNIVRPLSFVSLAFDPGWRTWSSTCNPNSRLPQFASLAQVISKFADMATLRTDRNGCDEFTRFAAIPSATSS
jgi:hypothetical protein